MNSAFDLKGGSLLGLSVYLSIVLVGFAAGAFGSMVGVGGGALVVPILTLGFGVPIHNAVGASVVAVIATSSAGAANYVRDRLSNVRLGLTLELFTTVGGVIGGLLGSELSTTALTAIFGLFTFLASYMVFRHPCGAEEPVAKADDLGLLGTTFRDVRTDWEVRYRVRRVPLGLAASFLAGNLSGLLGVGGGIIMVSVMTLAMGVPLKAAMATSSFTIGVTAAASAFIYFTRGMINPLIAAPTAIGVYAGATFGSWLGPRLDSRTLARIFALVVSIMGVQMIWKVLTGVIR